MIIDHAPKWSRHLIFSTSFSLSMNGIPCLRAGTGTRERRLVSCSYSRSGSAPGDNSSRAHRACPSQKRWIILASILSAEHLLSRGMFRPLSYWDVPLPLTSLCLRCFDYVISFPYFESPYDAAVSLSFTPLTRPGPDCFSSIPTRKSLLMIARTYISYTYKLTNPLPPFHFTNSWRISNT